MVEHCKAGIVIYWPPSKWKARLVLGSPEFNLSNTLVNSQLIGLWPVGILNCVGHTMKTIGLPITINYCGTHIMPDFCKFPPFIRDLSLNHYKRFPQNLLQFKHKLLPTVSLLTFLRFVLLCLFQSISNSKAGLPLMSIKLLNV